MSIFKIQNLNDNSIIEIVAMNIDNENNILTKEGETISVVNIEEFKDMVLGQNGREATYKITE